MSYLETLETRELLLLSSSLLSQYNTTRMNFENKAKHYGRQAITNNYHKEADLIALLEECERLKTQYNQITDILTERGTRNPLAGWNRSNDDLFVAKEVLHVS